MIQLFLCSKNFHCQPNCIFHSSKLKISQILPPAPLALFRIWWFPDTNKDKNAQTENIAITKKKNKKEREWERWTEEPFGLHLLTVSLNIGYVNEYFHTVSAKQHNLPHLNHRKWLFHSFGTSARYSNSLLNIACGGEFWMLKQQEAPWYVINSHAYHGNTLSVPAVALGWITSCANDSEIPTSWECLRFNICLSLGEAL